MTRYNRSITIRLAALWLCGISFNNQLPTLHKTVLLFSLALKQSKLFFMILIGFYLRDNPVPIRKELYQIWQYVYKFCKGGGGVVDPGHRHITNHTWYHKLRYIVSSKVCSVFSLHIFCFRFRFCWFWIKLCNYFIYNWATRTGCNWSFEERKGISISNCSLPPNFPLSIFLNSIHSE